MSFLNVIEIESALRGLATQYPAIARLITLPNTTAEGRTSHGLVVGRGQRCPNVVSLFVSGLHAREWGGPDIMVNLAADLLRAYTLGTGLTYGGKSFAAADIVRIIDRSRVIVFPCVNPDGRHFSQTSYGMWRKNRNPASSTPGVPASIGVDVNRNFDFLWDFPKHFAAAATSGGTLASNSPSSDLFHGKSPFSEPESRNVRWLFDQFPEIGRFIDLHSYGGDILHPWGDDENQTTTPSMNFTNSAHDGQRGVAGDAYREFIGSSELSQLQSAGAAIKAAIAAVRGKNYTVAQSFLLPSWGSPYPTSGVSDDWAFARRYLPRGGRTLGFTIEFNTVKTFFPSWAEMENLIRDICAGLVQFALDAAPTRSRWWIWCVIRELLYKWWRRLLPPDLWGPYGPWKQPGRPAG